MERGWLVSVNLRIEPSIQARRASECVSFHKHDAPASVFPLDWPDTLAGASCLYLADRPEKHARAESQATLSFALRTILRIRMSLSSECRPRPQFGETFTEKPLGETFQGKSWMAR